MKQIIIGLLAFLFLDAAGQIAPGLHTPINKPVLISSTSGGPLDAASQFYDATNFVYRDYQSVSEAQTYLNVAKWRVGNHIVFIHAAGTLNGNGTFTGGSTQFYLFANGTTNSALIPMMDFLYTGSALETTIGTMSTKLAGIATGATANSSDAVLLARANHTGTQAISTVTGLQAALDAKQATITTGTINTLYGYTPANPASYQPVDADLTTISGLTATTNNFLVSTSSAWASRTPAQVKTTLAIDQVDNTADAAKPVSTAQQTALNLKLNIADTVNMRPRFFPGANVSITGTYPAITISSSGSGSGMSAADFITGETPSGAINGTNVTFTFANTPIANKEIVYLNGIRQKRITDYTISAGVITFLTAPITGDELLADYLK